MVLVLVMVFFTFTLLANIIAAPFNGFLAEKVEVVARGEDHFPPFSWAELAAMVPRTMGRELRKLGYFLPRAIGLLILSFIPVVNLVAAPLWLLFGVWMMAVQYIDYPADNNKMSWQDMLAWLREKRWQSLSFGGITFRRYRGGVGFTVPTDKAFFYPEGIEGLFEIYYAPADTFETVNTLGQPLYARTIPDRDRDEWVRLEIESNPLPICTRPQVLRSARRT